MSDDDEVIYDSAPSGHDDDFWLEQGRKLVEGSVDAVQDAAKSLMTGLGLLKAIYLGILGFADFIPKNLHIVYQILFIVPFVFWLTALYFSLIVMMTKKIELNLHSPDDIRKALRDVLLEKQKYVMWGFVMLTAGIVAALVLIVIRLGL